MNTTPFLRKEDQQSVMRAIGPYVLAIFRESVDYGLYKYKENCGHEVNVSAHVEYASATRASMLNDRITAATRDLVDNAANLDLWWQMSENRRSTEIMLNPNIAFRIKRAKRSRGGLSTGINTQRQRNLKSNMVATAEQLVLPFSMQSVSMSAEDRIWLVVAFDLDDLEESLTEVSISAEVMGGTLWKTFLPEADSSEIASLPSALADRIMDMRQQRSA